MCVITCEFWIQLTFNMGVVNEDIEQCLKYVAKKEGIQSFTYEFSEERLNTDGYLGDSTYLEMKGVKFTGEEKTFQLFIKSSIDNNDFKRHTPMEEAYDREILYYNDIFRAFEDLQDEHNIRIKFSSKPKFYGYLIFNNRHHIVLENIKTKGFKLHDRKKPMDFKHAKLVFKGYAKLHALSFALKEHKPTLFRDMSKNFTDLMGKLILQMNLIPNYETMLDKIRKVLEGNGDLEVLQKLEGYEKYISYIIGALCSEEKYDFVFLHGDCWNNNYMFKYEDDNETEPIEVCFVDWQLSRVSSPTVDLAHYLYSCTSEKEINKLDQLLDIYHDELCNFLHQLGCNPQKIFPKQRLLRHYKKYAKYGVILMLLLLQISLLDSDETPDIVKASETGDFTQSYCYDIRDQNVLNARARSVLVHAVERDLL